MSTALLHRRGAVALALAFLLGINPAAADKPAHEIPAQSLSGALLALATQTDISIGLTGVNLTNLTSRALVSYDTVEEALRLLLAGTGLEFEMVNPSTWRIFAPARQAASLPQKPTIPLTAPPMKEITVTAEMRPVALQVTPLSIAAVTNNVFSDYGVRSPKELTSFIAGLSATNQGPGRNKFVVRGLADGPFIGNTQSTVGIYVDETRAIFNAPDPNLQLFDIERVEVIRGPQGTLYGAGSIGGLVRIITRQPNFEKFEAQAKIDGNVSASSGSFGSAEAMLNVPLVDDKLALRSVGYVMHAGGFVDNTTLAQNRANSTDIKGIRTGLRLRLSPDWTVGTGIIYQTIHEGDTQYFNAAMAPFKRRNLVAEPSKNDFLDVNVSVDGDLQWATLISTTAWVVQHVGARFDASLALPLLIRLPAMPTAYDQRSHYHTVSHESRLVSSGLGRFQWLGGISFAHRQDASNATLAVLSQPTIDNFYTKIRHDTGTEISAFGEARYQFDSQWSAGLGLRVYRGTAGVTANNTEEIDIGPPNAVGANRKVGVTPKAQVSYQVTPQLLFYTQAAQGFRLGGINVASRLTTATNGARPLTVSNFHSDRLWNFEVGSKATLFDQRLTFNTTLFYALWTNMQADLIRPNGLSFTSNIGKAHDKGFEIESAFVPSKHFRLLGNVSWSNPTFPQITGTASPRLPVAPKFSGNLAAQYETELDDDLTGIVNLKYEYKGVARLAVGSLPMSEVPAYHTVNLRMGIAHEEWKMFFYINNITDNRTSTYAFGNPFSLGRFPQVIPLRPRAFGLNIAWTR